MPEPKKIGPYRVIRLLGRGGMGVVYEVEDYQTPRHLALKLIRDRAASDTAVELFWREADALSRIQHRNVVRIHRIGELPEGSFVLHELVEGSSLDAALERGGRSRLRAQRRSCTLWRRRSPRSTPSGSCTGISSRPTSSSSPATFRCCSTSAWLATRAPSN